MTATAERSPAGRRAPVTAPTGSRRTGWLPWAAMALVVVVALAVGTFARPDASAGERARKLAGTIRCPSCKSQSAADSDTPASEAVRELIRRRIASGDSDEEILDFVTNRYPDTSLKPSGRGFTGLVWALPVVVAVVAVAALAFRFRDWRPGTVAVTDEDRDLVARAVAAERDGLPPPGRIDGS